MEESGGASTAGVRQRATESAPTTASDVGSEERGQRYDERAAMLKMYEEHFRGVRQFQMWLMVTIGLVLVAFFALHDTPAELVPRKLLFEFLFLPVYLVACLLMVLTRHNFAVNDVIGRVSLFMMGVGTCFVLLSLLSSILLALSTVDDTSALLSRGRAGAGAGAGAGAEWPLGPN